MKVIKVQFVTRPLTKKEKKETGISSMTASFVVKTSVKNEKTARKIIKEAIKMFNEREEFEFFRSIIGMKAILKQKQHYGIDKRTTRHHNK